MHFTAGQEGKLKQTSGLGYYKLIDLTKIEFNVKYVLFEFF